MIVARSAALAIALLGGAGLATSLDAQTTATLNVTVRVVEECTVLSKRELVKLARKLNDPSLIRRCSKGVVSRVNQRVVDIAKLQPVEPVRSRTKTKRIVRTTKSGETDVVLVTVTY
jgi:hypothetical protein